jgi:hypothetical protein
MATKYEKFREAILEQDPEEKRAIHARFQGDDDNDEKRKLWPLVLGHNESGSEEIALCYQYGGHTDLELEPHVSFRNLRCLKLHKLRDVSKEVFDASPQGEGFDPPVLTFKQVKKQNCIDEVDVHRQS